MPRRRTSALAAALLALLALLAAGCERAPAAPAAAETAGPREKLGLMTSLPLYWPLGAGVEEIAAGRAPPPWQRVALEAAYAIEPLDSLAPIPGLTPDAPATDPLAGLTRLAVIQPRGLSPADNVALDAWVRGGGRLLLVLDPALTGEYDLALGDPRRPAESALIPPVVARWGLAVRFDEAQDSKIVDTAFGDTYLPLVLAGEVAVTDPSAAACTLAAGGAAARCTVGKGEVTLIADAALFEHHNLAGEGEIHLRRLVAEVLG
ncbi:DUF4350 domain-containing protein [Erythrobacter oryzae]|uniref:DUF4350 domain-containing protein n=1 Tax=Erythrobacter oryzae TaxID=3019556 RepID=UPI002556488D|nr:DUF4350 domain-containing protein [Erythrobacter sp. COR-2]